MRERAASLSSVNMRSLLIFPHVQAKKTMQIAGLYFLRCNTYHIAPKPTQLEIAEYPENALFRRLESMQPREKPLQLEPGQILLAVYGDNWYVHPSPAMSRRPPSSPASCVSSHVSNALIVLDGSRNKSWEHLCRVVRSGIQKAVRRRGIWYLG